MTRCMSRIIGRQLCATSVCSMTAQSPPFKKCAPADCQIPSINQIPAPTNVVDLMQAFPHLPNRLGAHMLPSCIHIKIWLPVDVVRRRVLYFRTSRQATRLACSMLG